ncbi:hypothetical protein Tco_0070871 [Tanacetum coccineum]
MYFQKNVDYVELLWEDFTYQIDNKDFKKQEKMYYPRFIKVIIHHFLIQEKTLSWRNKIGMHTSKDDYLINTLRFVSRKEASQIYGAVLPECLNQEPSLETSQNERKKEKVGEFLFSCKGIELLSEVALTKKAQLKEVRKKRLRDFHKTHPSSSGTVAEKPPSVEKITPTVTSDKLGVPDVTEDDSTESESESWEQDEESDDDNQEEEEVDQENESEDDEIESDEDKRMDDITNQFDDDVDIRLEEPTQTVTLAKVSSQPHFTYEAASTLTEFKLKKILIDKIEKSESYLAALEHRDCYDSLKKSYDLDKDFFFSYDVYSLKRGKKDKDKDEDPSVGLDRGLKKRKASKDAEPTTEELVFEVADLNMPQDQEGNMGDNEK